MFQPVWMTHSQGAWPFASFDLSQGALMQRAYVVLHIVFMPLKSAGFFGSSAAAADRAIASRITV